MACAAVCVAALGAGCGSGAAAPDGSGTLDAEAVTVGVDAASETSSASTDAAATSAPSPPTVRADASTAGEQPASQDQSSVEPSASQDQPAGEPTNSGAPAIEATPDEAPATTVAAPSGGDVALDGDTGPEPAQPEVAAAVSVFPPLGDSDSVARWTVEIVEWAPHDPHAFTQGLEVADGTMYESTGLWGRSSLRAVDSATGEVTRLVELSDEHFGEGLTVVGDNLIQLTWQAGTAIVYDRDSFAVSGRHDYAGEGWGLCLSDDVLVMSDGSDRLARRDPATFELLGTVELSAPGYEGPLHYLNELECAEGLVIANVWQTERLLVIDPHTGRVVAVVDAGPLVDDVVQNSAAGSIDVLNGVAVSDSDGTLWMTGKLWPRLYRVRIVEMP